MDCNSKLWGQTPRLGKSDPSLTCAKKPIITRFSKIALAAIKEMRFKNMHTLKIDFWPHTKRENIASFRIRCLNLKNELSQMRVVTRFYKPWRNPADIIILSKRYDEKSISHAMEVKKKFGSKIILDICDNHFIYDNNSSNTKSNAKAFKDAIKSVDHVITSSEYLKDLVLTECGDSIKVSVMFDLVEMVNNPNFFAKLKDCKAEIELNKFAKKLRKENNDRMRRLVWFGNHRGSYHQAGMQDLECMKPAIVALSKTHPVSLTVISNSVSKFEELIQGWDIPVFYLNWRKNTISRALLMHGISLIPVTPNPFTLAKTANRVTTSLMHGLQVVADEIPSYTDFNDSIYLNDYEKSFNSLYSGDLKKIECFNFKLYNDSVVNGWLCLLNRMM